MHELFTAPYKPTLINISDQKEEMVRLSKIRHSSLMAEPVIKKYKSYTENYKKSSFPVYNIKTVSTLTNNTKEINGKNINYNIYPLKREIIIRNPEEIIESGILKSSIRKEGYPSIYEEPKFNPFTGIHINQELNNNNISEPIQIKQNLEDKVQDIEEPNQEILDKNIPQSTEPTNEIDKIIPGKITETVKIDENELEEMENEENPQPEENNEIPVEETITAKKYIIKSGNIVSLPENYSTDDEDEMIAINTLNEDISSWKKYTDKDGIKLYFKPYPVKDEEGKDVESVIGYCEAILDFPASKVISKMNDFEFRKNVDDQYKKGNLISERMEGNIKYMDMYLFMKMPFIFSDRDFVVRKKCWLDYNGNKDHALFYIHSIESPEYPPKKKLVRGNYANRSGYIKPLGDNQCQLNVVTAMDVKMSLGVSTMSKNGAEMQEKWVKNLRKQLAK